VNKLEFDHSKSQSNKIKHGIDFHEAELIWQDPDFVELEAIPFDDESRCIIVGRIGQKHWSAVITYRGENIRIISVRRSRKVEIKIYES
jgi:uncharacterized protein